MKHAPFVHLHLHSQYSLLDGAIRIDELLQAAREFKMPAVAVTDHGNVYGAVEFYQKAYKYGVKPIIGCELYVAPGSRTDKEQGREEEIAHHLTALVKNAEGYRNLTKLTSTAFLEGFYYRPRVDKELLRLHTGGLIVLSACLQGEIPWRLRRGDREGAKRAALEYRDMVGPENFFLEIMENGLQEQTEVNRELIALGKELEIPLVATNDCHYLRRKDAEAHEILLCIQTGKTIEDPGRMRFQTDEFYFKSPEEMEAQFHYCPEALENAVRIAERCNFSFKFDENYLPRFELDREFTADAYLARLAREGLERILDPLVREKGPEVREVYEKRLQSELEIIRDMGFPGYFLIVSDFVNYAKKEGIPVGPGRGSAAGSLVAYALGITSIDPIRYALFFERFLNPSRKSMPDIDIDFDMEGRESVIRYVQEKYGHDHVAQIITFGKMQARAVVRDVGRALNMSYGEVDRIAKMIPGTLNIKLQDAIDGEVRLREERDKDPRVKKLLDLSLTLEGLTRHASTHAAGVVISDRPLVERVPLCRTTGGDVMTQYSMNDLQSVGLTKFDFLGLRTLTIIRKTLDFIREGRGTEIDMAALPLKDEKTYHLLCRGQTDGVFQLESSGMKDILVNMRPDCLEDVIALISLYRPGPMNMVPDFIARKQGRKEIVYDHPALADVLEETYGVILYQEQVMQIASRVGNYTLAEADTLRRLMSKKKPEEMEKEKPHFLEGARKNGISAEAAERIWGQMETFAGYGFNKSHGTAYAVISYQTAYLKAHYPVEFMAALLTSEKNNRDNIIKYIASCREMGIEVLPPGINESDRDFSVHGDRIRFGMTAVKNVGEGAVDAILEARDEGPFTSFYDFCCRLDFRRVNRKVLESLIKCGAFDGLERNRARLFEGCERVVETVQRRLRAKASRQMSLFDLGPETAEPEPEIPDVPPWDSRSQLLFEKEMLGFYVTGHPMDRFGDRYRVLADCDSEGLAGRPDESDVALAGIVSHIRQVSTKKKETMAYATMEDRKGNFTVIVFPELFRKSVDLLQGDDPLLVSGTVDASEESVKVKATEIVPLEEAIGKSYTSVHFTADVTSLEEGILTSLAALCRKFPGKHKAFLHLVHPGRSETVVSLGERYGVRICEEIRREGEFLLGAGSTRIS
ncbi:MAG TPA: DNA polymerase III subunit alpha [Syntrophales bacterium]|nr:DNA polymerase III subunit alpha [Syntrophales bacterium]HQN78038.1 DNA polymerase III subunit alpha [Syntrophales bacterium]HQQ26963.1 DNA polymerase III subunit alpha [Syntrophales bacterium]